MNVFAVNDMVLLVKDKTSGVISAVEKVLPLKKKHSGKFDHTKATNFELIYTVTFEDNSSKRFFSYQLENPPKVKIKNADKKVCI